MRPVKRVLVVDDDRDTRAIIEETLISGGFDVDTASDSRMALRKIEATRYDVAIVDLMLPDLDGVLLQGRIRQSDPELAGKVIFTTGFTDRPVVLKALKHLGRGFLAKPFETGQLLAAVRESLNPAADPGSPGGPDATRRNSGSQPG